MDNGEKDVCIQREAECKAESYALNKRLKILGYANWFTVLIPSLLAVIAGSALFVTDEYWKPIMSGSVLVAAVLTAVHKGLGCDAYQIECRRLIQAYHGLETRYRTLHEIRKENWLDDFLKLENQLAVLREGASLRLVPKYQDKKNCVDS